MNTNNVYQSIRAVVHTEHINQVLNPHKYHDKLSTVRFPRMPLVGLFIILNES